MRGGRIVHGYGLDDDVSRFAEGSSDGSAIAPNLSANPSAEGFPTRVALASSPGEVCEASVVHRVGFLLELPERRNRTSEPRAPTAPPLAYCYND